MPRILTIKRLLPVLLLLLASAGISWFIAINISGSDFPVYYSAARQLLEPGSVIEDIYQTDSVNGPVILPERHDAGNYFIYSPVIAVLMSPMALFPYYVAKGIFIFVNITSYGASVALLLFLVQRWSWKTFFLGCFLFWMPFLDNVCGAQVNSLLLLCIVGTMYYAHANHHIIAGSLLGFAGLFKIFPLGFAFLLGLSYPKLLLTSVFAFAVGLLSPGTFQWFQAIPTVSAGYTPIYLFAQSHGMGWQLIFSGLTLGVSLFCLACAKDIPLLALFAYVVPATLVSMPVVQYHHLILLVIPSLIVFAVPSLYSLPSVSQLILIGAILHINLRSFLPFLLDDYWSLLVVWAVLSWHLSATTRDYQPGVG